MGLFSKRPKETPKIFFEEIEFEYQDDVGWRFSFRDHEWWAFSAAFHCPSLFDLEEILSVVNNLQAEMRVRIQKELQSYGPNLSAETAKEVLIVTDWAKSKRFIVSFSDGSDWGDLAVDFEIEAGAIVSESWGD
jgi:hypothetical protein